MSDPHGGYDWDDDDGPGPLGTAIVIVLALGMIGCIAYIGCVVVS